MSSEPKKPRYRGPKITITLRNPALSDPRVVKALEALAAACNAVSREHRKPVAP